MLPAAIAEQAVYPIYPLEWIPIMTAAEDERDDDSEQGPASRTEGNAAP